MKKVHDIIRILVGDDRKKIITQLQPSLEQMTEKSFPVAFIQWGNAIDGFEYEFFCPFCADAVGWWVPADYSYGALAENGAAAVAEHYKKGCGMWGGNLAVELATEPLNTTTKPRIL